MPFRRSVLALFLICCATATFAQFTPFGGAAGGAGDTNPQKVTLQGAVTKRSGDTVEGTITATIAPSWHINSAHPLDEFAIPTALSLKNATLVGQPQFPPHEVKSFTFNQGAKLAVYEGTIRIPFTAKVDPNAKTIVASLHYQSCNDQVCLRPTDTTVEFSADAAAGAAPGTAAPASGFVPLTEAPKNAAKPSLFGTDVKATFESYGLTITLLAIFVLGLGLNLTPCVYPVIPITVGYFSQQSGASRGRRVMLSSVYVLGLAATYSVLGVFAALSGRVFGAWMQLPAVLIFFALLMLVLASSMFGLFEITVPQFVTRYSGGQAGVAGALVMGLLIGIVAAPCVGPFVAALIALVAHLGSPLLGFLMFFVLALGLGLPYLLLGIFSSAAASLPRAGMWMVQVKKAMGFVLIAMAFYFLRGVVGENVFRYGVAASLLIGAVFLFASRTPGARALRLAMATVLLIAGAAFAVPHKTSGMRWDKYDESALRAAAASHKPVIIDFSADWCIPCHELDQETFSDPKVTAELDRFVRLKADMTASDDPQSIALSKQYSVVGMPTIVFIDANGKELPALRLTGFEKPEKFLSRAQQAH